MGRKTLLNQSINPVSVLLEQVKLHLSPACIRDPAFSKTLSTCHSM